MAHIEEAMSKKGFVKKAGTILLSYDVFASLIYSFLFYTHPEQNIQN